MLLVTPFGIGQREQDGAFLARSPPRQAAVHSRLGALIGQVLTPATQIRGSRLAFGVHAAIIAEQTQNRTNPMESCDFAFPSSR